MIPDWTVLVRRLAFGGRPFLRLIEAEAAAQLGRLRDHGLCPDHLDSHQHVHVLPALWPLCCRLAQTNGIPRLRVPATPRWSLVRRSASAAVLQGLALRRLRQRPHSLPCIGLAHSGGNTLSSIERELTRAAGTDVEMVVHPGVTTPALSARYPAWRYDWSRERELLLGTGFPEMIARHGYRLAD